MAEGWTDYVRRAPRSLIGRITALALVFLIVPLILFHKFAEADRERQNLLLRSLQAEGRLVAQDLEPLLSHPGGRGFLDIATALQALKADPMRIKLLLRPTGQADSFFLVAASPPLDAVSLDQERRALTETGVLPRLDQSCDGDRGLEIRYRAASGSDEMLTSISPMHSAAGCWVVLTSFATEDLAQASLARPFIQASEVRLALLFYGLMALLIGAIMAGTLFDLRGFARVAKTIRQGGALGKPSFAAIAGIPELLPVAREFDRMVAKLDSSAQALREAAEDNAHAFKAPIAAVTQALEPLRRLTADDQAAGQAVMVIDHALSRLNDLVSAARRLDEAAADVMTARLRPIDLGALAHQMIGAYDRISSPRGVQMLVRAEAGILVAASEDSLELVLENLLDNALSFAPAGSDVVLTVALAGKMISLIVEDSGPGVPIDQLASIFRRNFSYRPDEDRGEGHSGIGLAVVRRTIELLGGEVSAENRPGGGFRVQIMLPVA